MSFIDTEAQGAGQYVNPANVKYSSALPTGTPASQSVRAFGPNNGATFSPDGNGVIRIPIAENAFLSPMESYLKFTVHNTTAGGAALTHDLELQGSAFSFFSEYKLEGPNGNTIDHITAYAPCMSMVSDYTMPLTWRQSVGAATMGFGAKAYTTSSSVLNTAVSPDPNNGRYHTIDAKDGVGADIPYGGEMTYTIPLQGLLGQSKYLPIKYVGSGGMVIELTLNAFNHAVVNTAGNAVTWEIKNVSYVATLVKFDSQFEASFSQIMNMGGVKIHSTTYKNVTAYSTDGGEYSVPVGISARSIKSLFAIQRPTALLIGGADQNKSDIREPSGLTSYQWQIGSTLYPQKPVKLGAEAVDNGAEALTEMLKAFGISLNSINEGGSIISYDNYNTQAYVAATPGTIAAGYASYDANPSAFYAQPKRCGKFAIGLDCESFTRSGLESGVNNKDQALPITLNVMRAGGRAQRIDVFGLIDQVVTFNLDGSISVAN